MATKRALASATAELRAVRSWRVARAKGRPGRRTGNVRPRPPGRPFPPRGRSPCATPPPLPMPYPPRPPSRMPRGPCRLPSVPGTTPSRAPARLPCPHFPAGPNCPGAKSRRRFNGRARSRSMLTPAARRRRWTIAGVVQYLGKLTNLNPLQSQSEAIRMTDWSTCPAVERKAGEGQRSVGLRRHADPTVRALREPGQRSHGRRVRRVVPQRRRAAGPRRTRTRGEHAEQGGGALKVLFDQGAPAPLRDHLPEQFGPSFPRIG